MPTLDQRVRPHPPGCRHGTRRGGGCSSAFGKPNVLQPQSPPAKRIWQRLKQGLALNDISCRLQEEFDVDAEHADKSVLDLVSDLCQQRLVEAETTIP